MDTPIQPELFIDLSLPELKSYRKQIESSIYYKIIKKKPCYKNLVVYKNFSRMAPVSHPKLGNGRTDVKKIKIYLDNSIYIGEFNNKYERDGFGVLVTHDGSLYEGYFTNGKYNGEGRLITTAGDIFMGTWASEVLQGRGHIYTETPYSYYSGEITDNLPNGQGILTSHNHSVYTGSFNLGKKEGSGTLKFADGSYYDGEFKKNKQNGQGIFYFKDKSFISGNWENGHVNGIATKKWADGKIYEGELKEGIAEGKGKMVWPDGKQYEGYWKSDRPNGHGTLTKKNGAIVEGNWSAGKVYHLIRETAPKERLASKRICESVEDLEEKVKEARKHYKADNLQDFNALLAAHEVKIHFEKQVQMSEKLRRQEDRVEAKILKNEKIKAEIRSAPKPVQKLEEQVEVAEVLNEFLVEDFDEKYKEILKKRARSNKFEYYEPHVEVAEVSAFQETWVDIGKEMIYRGGVDSNDQPSGFGVILSPKFIYEGFFAQGKRHGVGREIRLHGEYCGYYHEDLRSGFGVKKSGKTVYVGDFENDVQEGFGTLETPKAYYEGEWKHGKQHGKGMLRYDDGRVYEGDFDSGVIKGYGTITWPNGKSILGSWENGQILEQDEDSKITWKSGVSVNLA